MVRQEARITNKFVKLNTSNGEFTFNAMPYEFAFELELQCRGMNEASMIIEQIASKFNPNYTLRINEVPNQIEPTTVHVQLLDIAMVAEEYEDISVNLVTVSAGLSLKGNFYPPIQEMEKIENVYNFKTPLNVVITDHQPERFFVRELIKQENVQVVDSWIKSTDQDFYPIEYSWKKGENQKRGRFNPDFFIKEGTNILVVEIKGDEETKEPSDENKAKYKAAKRHFSILNDQQSQIKYFFNFLTSEDYDYYFTQLRKKNFKFVSKLDAEFEKNGAKNNNR